MIAVLLSLAAAVTFSLSALLINALAGRVTVFQLARWQMSIAFALTAAASLVLGGWATVSPWQFWFLAASSATGIMLASTTYFAAIYAAGPRLTALLFSLAAPFAVLEGWLFLDEALSLGQLSGIALILGGIVLAIVAAGDTHPDDAPRRPLWQGITLGIITAIGQATGSLLARPAMEAGVEPFTAMAIRSGLGAAFFIVLMVLPFARADQRRCRDRLHPDLHHAHPDPADAVVHHPPRPGPRRMDRCRNGGGRNRTYQPVIMKKARARRAFQHSLDPNQPW